MCFIFLNLCGLKSLRNDQSNRHFYKADNRILRYLLNYNNTGNIFFSPFRIPCCLFYSWIVLFLFFFPDGKKKWDGRKTLPSVSFSLYENRVTDQLIYHHNWLGDFPAISLVAIDGPRMDLSLEKSPKSWGSLEAYIACHWLISPLTGHYDYLMVTHKNPILVSLDPTLKKKTLKRNPYKLLTLISCCIWTYKENRMNSDSLLM